MKIDISMEKEGRRSGVIGRKRVIKALKEDYFYFFHPFLLCTDILTQFHTRASAYAHTYIHTYIDLHTSTHLHMRLSKSRNDFKQINVENKNCHLNNNL